MVSVQPTLTCRMTHGAATAPAKPVDYRTSAPLLKRVTEISAAYICVTWNHHRVRHCKKSRWAGSLASGSRSATVQQVVGSVWYCSKIQTAFQNHNLLRSLNKRRRAYGSVGAVVVSRCTGRIGLRYPTRSCRSSDDR